VAANFSWRSGNASRRNPLDGDGDGVRERFPILADAIGRTPFSPPKILAGEQPGFPAWGRRSRGDRGQVRSCGQPWRQRGQTGASTGSDPPHSSRAARKPFLLRASLRAQVWSRGAQPGPRRPSGHPRQQNLPPPPANPNSRSVPCPRFPLNLFLLPISIGLMNWQPCIPLFISD
jgi:hypothetical protein